MSSSAVHSSPTPNRRGAGRDPAARGHAARGRIDTGRIILFALITLTVAGLLAIPFALGVLPEEMVGIVVPLAQLVPLLTALIVRRREARIRDSLALTVPSRAALGIGCALAVLAFGLVPLVRLLTGVAGGLIPFVAPEAALSLLIAIPFVLVMQSVFAIGEETGWRGWLQTALRPLGFWPSALTIGVLWTLFHLPIALALGFDGRELVSYLALILAVSPLLSALREAGASVWPAVLGHGLLNSVRVAIDQNTTIGLGERSAAGFWGMEIIGWALWLGAAAVVHTVAVRRSRQ